MLQRFSITLFGLINYIILIRHLTKPEMGVWAFFLVVTTLFETAKSNLLKNAHIKFVGSNNDEKTAVASSSLLLNSGISILFILLLLFISGELSVWLGSGHQLEQSRLSGPIAADHTPSLAGGDREGHVGEQRGRSEFHARTAHRQLRHDASA